MVFLSQVRTILNAPVLKACVLLAVTTILTFGCSGRGEKKVAIVCAPGQTQGADGKCKASASTKGGSPGGNSTGVGGPGPGEEFPGADLPGPGEETPPPEDDNPNTSPNPDTPLGPQDNPNDTPQSQPNPQPGPSTPGDNNSPGTEPIGGPPPSPSTTPTNPNTNTQSANDPANIVESAAPLFKDAPQTTAEGAPTLAFKLINSPSQGKIARVAFSHTNGVTNAQYVYHKNNLTITPGTAAADGSLSFDFSSIPVSVTFEWNNKKCDTGQVEVSFEAATKIATCL